VAFSPDGKTFFTGENGMGWIRDIATGKPLGPPMRHHGHVEAVAFSPDGKTILTGSWDSTARLWDTATSQALGPPMRHAEAILATIFGANGKTILTGTTSGEVRILPMAELPDDLDRVTNWVESLTSLTLDASGFVQPLNRAAWLERRAKVERQGGSPVRDAGRELAPKPSYSNR